MIIGEGGRGLQRRLPQHLSTNPVLRSTSSFESPRHRRHRWRTCRSATGKIHIHESFPSDCRRFPRERRPTSGSVCKRYIPMYGFMFSPFLWILQGEVQRDCFGHSLRASEGRIVNDVTPAQTHERESYATRSVVLSSTRFLVTPPPSILPFAENAYNGNEGAAERHRRRLSYGDPQFG